MTTDEPVRCRRCHRRLVRSRWVAVELGETCAARLGLVLRTERRPRARQPVRTGGGVEQPSLLDLLETENDEINESEGT